ncbi:efflux RND transporter periplasmic adaptor subunit [Altericista sp. CCNU0014]|uniref:efflux RND transporter periplasmic adaptor subunit n=1 Tax=Altericista sp. CCNU0014 TaxID=3082949 RepID=UPI00384DD96A
MAHSAAELKASISALQRSWRTWAIAGAIGLAGTGWYVSQREAAPAVRSTVDAPVQIQPRTVTALGRLEPRGTVIKLSAPTSNNGNRVERLLVKEGDRVKAGQIIAILDDRDRLQAAFDEAEAQVRLAQAKLVQVRAGAKSGEIDAQAAKSRQIQIELQNDRASQADEISRVQAQWDGDRLSQEAAIRRLQAARNNARVEFERYRRLQAQGGISKSELDSKRLAFNTAQQQVEEAQAVLNRINLTAQRALDQAKTKFQRTIASGQQQVQQTNATLDQIREVRSVDVQVAEVEVDRATAAAKQAKANLDRASVKAPQDGTIMKIHTYAGEVVASTDGIVELGQNRNMDAVAEVYQSDFSKVKVGQKARITSDSLPGELTGTVARTGWQIQRQNVINTDPSANIDSRVAEVHVALDAESSRKAAKFTNLQVQVAIEL